MDMYYYYKDILTCQDCKHPLKYCHDIGYMSSIAECIGCGKKIEVNLEIKNYNEDQKNT